MGQWVRICGAHEMPASGEVAEVDVDGRQICLANIAGELHAMENICPHRAGPLGQGWIEGRAVVCPWHAWAFDVDTGLCDEPEKAQVQVFPVREENGAFLAELS